jgi:hypothetical protein
MLDAITLQLVRISSLNDLVSPNLSSHDLADDVLVGETVPVRIIALQYS